MSSSSPHQKIHRTLFLSTLSNYGFLLVRLLTTIFATRLLFLNLTREEYGFWALLWSFLGYSVLLDFGFGMAVQKYTSQVLSNGDWNKLNRILSTVFFNYCFFSIIISIVIVCLYFNIDSIFKFNENADIDYFRNVLLIFGLGTALVFPFGCFSEILRGAQMIPLRNILNSITTIINLIGIFIILHFDYKLLALTTFTIISSISNYITTVYLCKKRIPEIKISWSLYDSTTTKEVLGFSIFAYLISFSTIVIFRTDLVIVSILGSVSLGAIYQISSRFADMYKQFTNQIIEALGPSVAFLFEQNEKEKINRLLRYSNRYGSYIANFLIIPSILYLKPILNIWLNLTDPIAIQTAIILLLSIYIFIVYRTFTANVFLMINKHKELAIVAIIECLANVFLSVILIQYYGLIGVALGMFIPNTLLAIFYNVPQACRYAEMSIWKYLWEINLKTQILTLISGAASFFIYLKFYPDSLLLILIQGSLFSLFYWSSIFLFSINDYEKKKLYSYLESLWKVA